jgi:GntR family transcriptional repressor for pyruvate dehydrogenase complex
METTKITRRKIYEEIAGQIKSQIVKGGLKPGERLPSTKELTESYGVGRSTVREALSALKAWGLIDIRHGEGCYVKEADISEIGKPDFQTLIMNKQTILDLIEARKALEAANAALAAEKRTERDLTDLSAILLRMETNLGNETEGELADIQFHMALAKATQNSIMERLLETISGHMETAIRETRRLQMYSDRQESELLWREHKAIYEAVREQNAGEAQERMKKHLLHVEQVLTQFLT